jgi:hypothetical protein
MEFEMRRRNFFWRKEAQKECCTIFMVNECRRFLFLFLEILISYLILYDNFPALRREASKREQQMHNLETPSVKGKSEFVCTVVVGKKQSPGTIAFCGRSFFVCYLNAVMSRETNL